jgi:hypothetical protein
VLDAARVSGDPVANLQLGLAIELAVLPPYLYALWSLRGAADGGSPAALEAARTIRAVVYEEMLHAGLVGNLVNALGGTPVVGRPPMTYPNPLPGHVKGAPGPGWVSLQPMSLDAVNAFMAIELPIWDDPNPPPDGSWGTIGKLYDDIAKKLQTGSWPINPVRQLPLGDNPGPGQLVEVRDLAAARIAIETIVDQGEGHEQQTQTVDPAEAEEDDDHEVAHYDQFASIASAFGTGALSAANDVWPVVADPKAADFSQAQRAANAAFNCAYSELLDSLGTMFAATRPRIYGVPTDRMNQLAHLALLLRNTGPLPKDPAHLPGPTFEYLPAAKRGTC